jgi:hypothetical protein
MHGIGIVCPELCLEMPAGKGFAESTSRSFLSIWIYLRIGMSPTMPVTCLCISGLRCILYAFRGFRLGFETGIRMCGDRVMTFLCTA